MKDKKQEILKKIEFLNKAGQAYYRDGKEILSNFEYDKVYDELVALEEETGIVLGNSPTQNVGYEVLDGLPKEKHLEPMLSLDKTKEREELASWLGNQKGLISWKLDGLTVVLTYDEGKLIKAVTRGSGEIGEVITNNAKTFKNLPVQIPFEGKLTIRGEAFIKYSDFQKINEELPELDAKYKNPRNLCSGSVRQLNSQVTAERNVNFGAFSIGFAEGVDFNNSRINQMEWLRNQGFEIVEYKAAYQSDVIEKVDWFSKEIENMDIPSDGLVLIFDDIKYGEDLGNTAKFPRNAIAFKWRDEIKETELLEIEWSASRTGLINPVAIFTPVDLEGTTVARASVHNLSIVKDLMLGVGDRITVYKANMIIPQIAENLTKSGNIEIPEECPVCGGKTIIKKDADAEVLYCTNEECPAKKIKAFGLFVSRDAMNIDSLSEATLEKFISAGIIKTFVDLFRLKDHEEEIIALSGYGQKSYDKVIKNIDIARNTTVPRLLYGLGIPGIGVSNAKLIAKANGEDLTKIKDLTFDDLVVIDGIGEIMAKAFVDYFANIKNRELVNDLQREVTFAITEKLEEIFSGKGFVITGNVEHFQNRRALKEEIEKRGGKVAGSVSGKTDYLINNDVNSSSSKNKKAKELNIPIITEEDIIEMMK